MKLTKLSMLAMMIAASSAQGQTNGSPYGYAPSSQTYQFTRSGVPYQLQLCSTEICKIQKDEQLVIQPTGGGINAILQETASKPDESYLVFYPPGKTGVEDERHILRKKFLVKLKKNANAAQVQQRCSIDVFNVIYPEQGLAVCEAESAVDVLDLISSANGDAEVEYAEPLFARKRFKKEVPDDPLYAPTGGQDGTYQWSLVDPDDFGGTSGVHINVSKAWDLLDRAGNPINGSGMRVSVVDDGIFRTHPDLNVTLEGVNLNGGTGVGSDIPVNVDNMFDSHGTAVTGIIAGVRNNGLGMTGIASEAEILGIRLIAAPVDDQQESQALGEGTGFAPTHVSNNSWGPSDFTTELVPIGPLSHAAIMVATEGQAVPFIPAQRPFGAGTVFVWAGGNGGEIGDNSNYDGYANLPETIAVGAINDRGVRASYSERGANLIISAPSGGGDLGIVTTSFSPDFGDILNGYTSNYDTEFGGTSAAAPAVSAVAALMIQAHSFLNWREVQQIMMETATRIDPDNPDWYENAAGYWFNHNYGAGMINAEAAVQKALDTELNPGLLGSNHILPDRGEPLELSKFQVEEIPNGTGDSLVVTFDMSSQPNRRVEHVQLKTRIIAERRADLDIVLVSPSGTQSILAETHQNSDEQGISGFTFMTARNWGEGSAGVWYLRITDRNSANGVASFNDASLIINGPVDADAEVDFRPILLSDRVINTVEGQSFSYTISALATDSVEVNNLPDGFIFDPNTLTISGTPQEGGLFNVELILNGSDRTLETNLGFVVEPVTFSLGSAVEQDGRPTASSGSAPWVFELSADQTFDGEDALGSPLTLEANQESRFGFSNIEKSVALFKWRVSSEDGADRLWLSLEGGTLPHSWTSFIDGETAWKTVAVNLPRTANKIEWAYRKDDSLTSGVDRAFLDEVEFQTVDSFTKGVEAAGNFAADFEYSFDSRTLWFPVSDNLASDQLALQASGIGHGQNVSLSSWVEGPATLSFDYRTSLADTGDVLEYLVNGVVRQSTSGVTSAYANFTETIPPGRSYIQIRFRKDITGSAGTDSVWIDNLVVQTQLSALSWSEGYGLGGVSLDEDSDKDGYSNFEELAFGGNPTVKDIPKYAPTYKSDGPNRWIEYGVDSNNNFLNYEAQESSDLNEWIDSSFSSYDRTEGDVRFFRIPIFAYDPSKPKQYYRVNVTTR
ncbi:S8 family serine peptidase [Akkermansiaceae bacterium]|nr:S8 family serine peptidase [Akkermansiaceae bacterium]